MKIITTPMCEEIVRLAGITDYTVNKFPDEEDGDLAIVLSESKVEMDSLAIKINTPSQIFESIKEVSKLTGSELSDDEIIEFFSDYELTEENFDMIYEFMEQNGIDLLRIIEEEEEDIDIYLADEFLNILVDEENNDLILSQEDI